MAELGYTWLIWSLGPTRENTGNARSAQIVVLTYLDPGQESVILWAYDPTNGTVSAGYIMRSNKGIFPER